jgi:hypothetical protein
MAPALSRMWRRWFRLGPWRRLVFSEWKVAGACFDGEPISVEGINPWGLEWQLLRDDPVILPHPYYPRQQHKFWVYKVSPPGKDITFAAGELSNGVWGFYVRNPHYPADITVTP